MVSKDELIEGNGIIRSYVVSYSQNEEPHNIDTETLEGNMLYSRCVRWGHLSVPR